MNAAPPSPGVKKGARVREAEDRIPGLQLSVYLWERGGEVGPLRVPALIMLLLFRPPIRRSVSVGVQRRVSSLPQGS